jgi:hypothetical protein
MSILDNIEGNFASDQVANRIKNQTRQTFQNMVNAFNEGSKTFWQNPRGLTPIQIAEALGTDAREVFELHYALGLLINSIKPESIQEGWGVIGQFTMNEDGTVTILDSLPNPSGSV